MTDEIQFVPPEFDPPRALAVGSWRLEPLGPEHNDRDYAAWTSSMDHIRQSPGYPDGRWPREMSLDDNRSDLERHAADFRSRKGFTYTVLDAGDDVVGCVYVYPSKDGVHDTVILSWVRESVADRDGTLRQAVAEWITSDAWPFDRPLYEPLLG
jgi:hypothetical protein